MVCPSQTSRNPRYMWRRLAPDERQKFAHRTNPSQRELSYILQEARSRDYNFDASKIAASFKRSKLTVTKGQMDHEVQHLLRKLKIRDPKRFRQLRSIRSFEPHPMFRVKEGGIENWEVMPADR